MIKLHINFDNTTKIFTPGQTIIGRVIVECERQQQIKGLIIESKGIINVFFNDGESNVSNEGYLFSHKIYLIGNALYEENVLVTGRTEYLFQFPIPFDIPSTFYVLQGAGNGSVSYKLEVTLRKKSFGPDKKIESPYIVNSIVDLNSDSIRELAMKAMEVRKSKNLCCFCCKSGPIGLFFKIPKCGFIPGEFIPIVVEINNMSRKNIVGTHFKLIQRIHFYAHGKSKRLNDITVFEMFYEHEVIQGQCDSLENSVKVPLIPPSYLGSRNNFINVQYFVSVVLKISGPSVNLRGKVPILIGTIPLVSTINMSQGTNNEGIANEFYASPSASKS